MAWLRKKVCESLKVSKIEKIEILFLYKKRSIINTNEVKAIEVLKRKWKA